LGTPFFGNNLFLKILGFNFWGVMYKTIRGLFLPVFLIGSFSFVGAKQSCFNFNKKNAIYSVAVGAMSYGLNNLFTKNFETLCKNAHVFAPSKEYRAWFDQELCRMGVDSEKIVIRYMSTGGSVAAAYKNVIIIDPLTWNTDDVICKNAQIQYVSTFCNLGQWNQHLKVFFEQVHQVSTPESQRFIFRHEVGHLVAGDVKKRMSVNSLLAVGSYYLSMSFADRLTHSPFKKDMVIFASFLSMSLLFNILHNNTFIASQEKNADIFAAQYSTKEEILAAADFFEAHEKALDELQHVQGTWFSSKRFGKLVSGHMRGKERAQFLRKLAQEKDKKVL